MKTGILIGYYINEQDARDALRKLRHAGYRCAAAVSKRAEGGTHIVDPFGRHRIWVVAAAFILPGLIAAVIAMKVPWQISPYGQPLSVLIPAVACGIIGVLLSAVWMRRSRFGIERRLLTGHARRLIAEETALIVQSPIEQLRIAVPVLLQSGETPPAVFVLHPHRESPTCEQDTGIPDAPPLGSAQLQEHARHLAADHQLDSKPLRNTELLRRLKRSRRWVKQVCLDLSEASHLQQSVSPTAEWLLDNEYILESNARDVELNLPWRYYRQLPALAAAPDRGLPRIYGLARHLAADTDLSLYKENLLDFIDAYQSIAPLSIGELWAVPQMLRIVLIESIGQLAGRVLTELQEQEIADLWANRLISANRRDPSQLFSIMAELTDTYPRPSLYFASQLINHLYDEGAALAPVQSWLEHTFQKPLNELLVHVSSRQAKDQLSIANAFTSLRQLALLDWKECFERLSQTEQILRHDPAGIYPQMDFATRNRYRQAIEDLRRGSGLEEEQIAQQALDLAMAARPDSETDEGLSHIGTYLIGEKRNELARWIHCRETLRFRALHRAYCHPLAVYLLGLAFFSTVFIVLSVGLGLHAHSTGIQLLIAALLFIPVSQLAIEVLNTLIMRFFPSLALPKMDFRKSGIPDACRTLVVVPTILSDSETIKDDAEKLEIRYLANQDANLLFGLYSDFTDADAAHSAADAELLKHATECIETLNQRYGGDRFFLFHRQRTWCVSEQKFMGWERKRGKLEELNDLIVGTRPRQAERLVHVGDPNRLGDVRFVITLDSDTQLPADTARRMIETLAHPLNRARIGNDGRVQSGYTIIQPRVSPSLPSTSGSPFSRLFSDPVGIDPYTHTVSDVYQDLTGEGSYHGKGIYEVRPFSRVLSGRFPEGRLLSHDLIEGAHVRVGLASDIELYDEFPQDYNSYAKRQHRWIRGDWQIADWILPRVPLPDGGRGPNPLSRFDRWKIFDNLRRSLLPIANIAVLIAAWLISSQAGWTAGIAVAAQLFFHSLIQPFTWATTRQGLKGASSAKVAHDLLQMVVEAALLPYQAWLAMDAIGRVWYRRCISHRGLLEWMPARTMRAKHQAASPMFFLFMGLISAFSVLVGWAMMYGRLATLGAAVPWLMLWFLAPIIGWLLNRRPSVKTPHDRLPEKDRKFLRQIARYTWRYFSDFVNEQTSWLPPDNYQVSHQNGLAMRTSPTNIGLYLVSVLSAQDFGYLTIDEVTETLSRTLETIQKLDRHEGHLLNWYDIQTLTPLAPQYVSTVDSGNLLGALWTLDRGLESLMQSPLLGKQAFAGLYDAGAILRQVGREKSALALERRPFQDLLSDWDAPPASLPDRLRLLRRTNISLKQLSENVIDSSVEAETVTYWLGQIQHQQAAWQDIADRYLIWVEILAEKTEDQIADLAPEAVSAFRQALQHAPSLHELAGGNIPYIDALRSLREKTPDTMHALLDWIDRVIAAFDRAKWLAGEMLASTVHLARTCGELSASINMRFLYNSERRLFSIGFNVSEGRMDRAFYDLLASEARLGSFVAIARGDIPVEHWFAMGRPYGAIGRRRALLSWTGTMFEYLMPLLFQRSYSNTLLDKAAREAIAIQMSYGRKHRVAWGISECAFGDLDIHKTYQYQAFGVPELGLKRGRADKIVVAPYASLLAVTVEPRHVVQNLKRLAGLGLLSDYGYYESLDYSRQPRHAAEPGVIVRDYMAHHQGMSFLALTNFLHDNRLCRHFHADPRVRTLEPLLHERIPQLPPLHHVAPRERIASVAGVGEATPSARQFETPHTVTPKTQLLCNGRYGLMVTGAGGGYSRWNDISITRWQADATRDAWGSFCYIRDAESGWLWCNTYQPTGGTVEPYCVNFSLDRAVFRRVDHDIESETEIIVAPEDDVEIRRMTLINRSTRTRRIELTSYIELAMAPHRADRQHPAFNKLFIQTEALPEQQTLLAYRRLRSNDETPVYAAHRFTLDYAAGEPIDDVFRFETDRRQFIGRGRTLASPMGAVQELCGSQGFVLDPIFSLRRRLSLAPGQRVQASLILAAGSSRQEVTDLMSKYGDSHAIDRAIDFAWASAQLELRFMRIQPDEARCFQKLASHLLYPNPRLRAAAQRIADNHKGQAGLWAYGISGDLPIALVAVGQTRDIGLVRQMLQAHTYWRMHGLMTDLVIINEEISGYTQPLRQEIEHLIQSHSTATGVNRPGGIFLRSADLIPADDRTLLWAAASVAMVSARGTLSQQLAAPSIEAPDLPGRLAQKRDPRDPSAALPFMELLYFNSLGGFTPDGREYAIYLGPGTHTPAPWTNVMANPEFGTLVSETGAGFTWQGNSQRNRLTQWSNDPVMDPSSEAIYLRDEDTGAYWTPTASPIRQESAYRARHGAGYTVFEHNSHGIEQELTVFVPMDDHGGEPIKLQKLTLRNDSGRPRKLSLTYYVEWTLGETREASRMHVVTAWDDQAQTMLARNRYHPDYADRVAFAAVSAPTTSYTGSRSTFLGRNRSPSNPAAMERSALSRRTGAGMDPCAAVQVTVKLAPGERTEITCMLGQARSVEQVHALVKTYRNSAQSATALQQTQKWWDGRLGAIQVHTPEPAADLLINRWLLYQSLSCRMWARSGFYQSGGAFGFRDQLQDVMALLYAHSQLAREHILLAAGRQFKEGDVQHWWHPPGGEGVRTRISDDLLWLPFVVAQYIRVTADVSILHEIVPFLDAPLLHDDQHETFQSPSVSSEQATLFEHCRRTLEHSRRAGPNGLPLIGGGDWNDGMNQVGAGGKGESVWLGWFRAEVLQGMVELADLLGRSELGQSYTQERKSLVERIEQVAWDGKWYLRATYDDGTPLGAAGNMEAQIDSLPQSWAWLSDAADRERAEQALESAWKHLVREEEGLVLLFEPPFDQPERSPGYIKGYPPGVRENGGQYTHAAIWLAMAMARRGDGDRATKILRMLNPIEHAREPKSVWRYGIEPYVVAADVYRLPGRVGQGGWSWYTGSASWMYRAWVEEVLGLKIRGETMQFNPVIPGGWDGFQMSYRHGEAIYEIQVENPQHCRHGVVRVEMDGQPIKDGVILLVRDLIKHRVLIRMGTAPPIS